MRTTSWRDQPEEPSPSELARRKGAAKGWGGVARSGAARLGDDLSRSSPVAPDERNKSRALESSKPAQEGDWVRVDEAPTPPRSPQRQKPKQRKSSSSSPIDEQLVFDELSRTLPPGRANRNAKLVVEAARHFVDEQFEDARSLLRGVAELAPDSPSIREIYGLTLYSLRRWRPAIKELEASQTMTREVDQHPVLMDCYRAIGKHDETERLWVELRDHSPTADIMAEGRIVAAGSLADRGRLADAIRLLEAAPRGKKAREHHFRTSYALGDLYERAGDVARARELFRWITNLEPHFADAADRAKSLS